jgi:hypothetical protein
MIESKTAVRGKYLKPNHCDAEMLRSALTAKVSFARAGPRVAALHALKAGAASF